MPEENEENIQADMAVYAVYSSVKYLVSCKDKIKKNHLDLLEEAREHLCSILQEMKDKS